MDDIRPKIDYNDFTFKDLIDCSYSLGLTIQQIVEAIQNKKEIYFASKEEILKLNSKNRLDFNKLMYCEVGEKWLLVENLGETSYSLDELTTNINVAIKTLQGE